MASKHVPHDPDELIAIVNENDNVIGKATRRVVHNDGKLHRQSSVLILNSKREILLQKRKDNGKLDYSASGHFPYNTDYLDAAVRETEEELGLKISKSKFIKILKKRDSSDSKNDCFVCLFEVKADYKISDIKIDPLEVESVRYYSINEIKGILDKDKSVGGFLGILREYIKKGNRTR